CSYRNAQGRQLSGSVLAGSRRYHPELPAVSFRPALPSRQRHQHEQFEDYLSSIGSGGAVGTTTYSALYASSRRDTDNESMSHFEENLRAELGKISANYDSYLAERATGAGGTRSTEFRASFRSSASRGRRW
uniref:IF rod domain-containing protein n=1 Tax=Macrostomum lignano TaxID=282301 RepID=A0A1I8GKY7_9PLAT